MPHRVALLILLAGLALAACGDHKKKPTDGSGDTKAEGTDGTTGGTTGGTPHIGRDAKQVLSAFGEEGREVIEQADTVTLLTVNPARIVDGKLSPEAERIRGYGILGSADIPDAGERRRLIEALYEGLKGEGAGPASCFLPRHALRFQKGRRVIEALICFECTWVYLFEDGVEKEKRMLFGAGVKPVFDSVIKARDLPVDGS
jgi:hypothetical protein